MFAFARFSRHSVCLGVVILVLLLTSSNSIPLQAQAAMTRTVNITVQPQLNQLSISPHIYGINYHPEIPITLLQTMNLDGRRLGGNRATGGNWENNASYSGTDLNPPQTDSFACSGNPTDCAIPAFPSNRFLTTYLPNTYSINTLPMAGWVAKQPFPTVSSGLDSSSFNPFLHFNQVVFKKPTPFQFPPNLNDNVIYEDEYLQYALNTYGNSNSSTGFQAYALDNEPGLWKNKHPHLRIPAGQAALVQYDQYGNPYYPNSQAVTVNELITKSTELADVVKDIDSNAEVFGPVLWGYPDYRNLNESSDFSTQCAGYETFVECYLGKMKQAATQTNHSRLLDVFDIHWYPELFIEVSPDKWVKIVKDGGSASTQDFQIARMQAPRALWDSLNNYQTFVQHPNNNTKTWLFQAGYGPTFFPLIPKLQTSIQTYYPGTKLAFTEFSPGGESDISGGIATADILGTFGKQGIYFASFWKTEEWVQGQEYIPAAYKLYRNYNGTNGTFGSTSVQVQSSDIPDSNGALNSSIYASIEGTNEQKLHLIILNKSLTNSMQGSINIDSSTISYTSAEAWGFGTPENGGSLTPLLTPRNPITNINNNVLTYENIPPLSAYHIVITGVPGGITPSTISGKVWQDNDQNGLRGGNEALLPNVSVTLWQVNSNSQIASTITDAGGAYQFIGLSATNSYQVRVTTPQNPFTQPNVNNNNSDLIDSDVDANGHTSVISLNTTTNLSTIDAGILPSTRILSGVVWTDIDGDGVMDVGEPKVPGDQVHLFTETYSWIAFTTTDENGQYTFPNNPVINGNNYIVQLFRPRSGGDPIFLTQIGLTPLQTNSNTNIPAPLTHTLSGAGWFDTDQDGINDTGETKAQGYWLHLFREEGGNWTWLDQVQLDVNGAYTSLIPFLVGKNYILQLFSLSNEMVAQQFYTPVTTTSSGNIPILPAPTSTPTRTPTSVPPTATPTHTPTSVPPTATNTPAPTNTPTGTSCNNILQNGGLEDGPSQYVWNLDGTTLITTGVHSGSYAVRIPKLKGITQSVSLSGLPSGSTLTFQGFYRTSGSIGTNMKVVMQFYNVQGQAISSPETVLTSTSAYSPFSLSSAIPTGAVSVTVLAWSNVTNSALLFVDTMSLNYCGGSTSTPVPPTATPTRTPTSVPPTATPTRTPTSVPPTATPTRTPTVVPSCGLGSVAFSQWSVVGCPQTNEYGLS